MLEIKSPVRSCNALDVSNLTQPKMKSANLTDKAIEITRSETQKKKKEFLGGWVRKQNRASRGCGTVSNNQAYVIKIPEEDEKENRVEKKYAEIMAERFLKVP